jgi:hypothetical protein
MSTLRVSNIKNESSPSGGLEIDSSGHVQIDGQQMPSAGPLSNRNLIINGAMNVAQRATQVTSVTTAGYRTCDRWLFSLNNLGTWTVDQATDAPEGFVKSFKATCTTADVTPAATDYLVLVQFIEAQNLQHLKYGTSNAENLILSFWVKSNKTGNASFECLQWDNSLRQFTTSYTINSANTWEYKTITIPGDPAGLINDDNGGGLAIGWWLNSGSDYIGGTHNATWETFTNTNRNSANLGVGGATSDYFMITGVQLELGTVATPFEHRSYGQELALCQRYYQDYSGIDVFGSCTGLDAAYANQKILPVVMRSTPTATFTWTSGTGATVAPVSGAAIRQSSLHSANSFTSTLTLDAEL